MQMLFFNLFLLCIFFASKSYENKLAQVSLYEDELFYGDPLSLQKTELKKIKEEFTNHSKRKILPNIKKINDYFTNNKVELLKPIEFKVKAKGRCLNYFNLKNLFSMSPNKIIIEEHLDAISNYLNEINYIYKDEYGNMLIFSVCKNLYHNTSNDVENYTKCFQNFVFISKIDFSFYNFTFSGKRMPSLTSFSVDFIVDDFSHKRQMFIFGGIDSKGNHNSDIYQFDIDYNLGNINVAKITNVDPVLRYNHIPQGLSEASFNTLQYEKENFFLTLCSFLIYKRQLISIIFGGSNDESISNKLYVYKHDKASWFKNDVNKDSIIIPRKEHSAVVYNKDLIKGDVMNRDIKRSYNLIIFGGKTENLYLNDIIIIKIDYAILDDEFSFKYYILENNKDIIGEFPEPRAGHKSFIQNDYLYVYGGCNYNTKKCFYENLFKLNLKHKPYKWEKENFNNFMNNNFSNDLVKIEPNNNKDKIFNENSFNNIKDAELVSNIVSYKNVFINISVYRNNDIPDSRSKNKFSIFVFNSECGGKNKLSNDYHFSEPNSTTDDYQPENMVLNQICNLEKKSSEEKFLWEYDCKSQIDNTKRNFNQLNDKIKLKNRKRTELEINLKTTTNAPVDDSRISIVNRNKKDKDAINNKKIKSIPIHDNINIIQNFSERDLQKEKDFDKKIENLIFDNKLKNLLFEYYKNIKNLDLNNTLGNNDNNYSQDNFLKDSFQGEKEKEKKLIKTYSLLQDNYKNNDAQIPHPAKIVNHYDAEDNEESFKIQDNSKTKDKIKRDKINTEQIISKKLLQILREHLATRSGLKKLESENKNQSHSHLYKEDFSSTKEKSKNSALIAEKNNRRKINNKHNKKLDNSKIRKNEESELVKDHARIITENIQNTTKKIFNDLEKNFLALVNKTEIINKANNEKINNLISEKFNILEKRNNKLNMFIFENDIKPYLSDELVTVNHNKNHTKRYELNFINLDEKILNISQSIRDKNNLIKDETYQQLQREIERTNKLQENITEINHSVKTENEQSHIMFKKLFEKIDLVNQRLENEFHEFLRTQEKINNSTAIFLKKEELKLSQPVKRCYNGFLFNDTICHCYPGFTGENCEILQFCNNNCNNNGICQYGKCFCNPGFIGSDCEEKEICANNCNNRGKCHLGKCFCDYGFSGPECEFKMKCENDCNNKGLCFRGKCLCETGYTGNDCSQISVQMAACKNDCNNNGACKMEKCFCYPGYSGKYCEIKHKFSCPSVNVNKSHNPSSSINLESSQEAPISPCSGNGLCKYGMCFCYPGFKGKACEKKETCLNNCSNNGICISGKCHCRNNIKSQDCSEHINLTRNLSFIKDEENKFNGLFHSSQFNNESDLKNNKNKTNFTKFENFHFIQLNEKLENTGKNKQTLFKNNESTPKFELILKKDFFPYHTFMNKNKNINNKEKDINTDFDKIIKRESIEVKSEPVGNHENLLSENHQLPIESQFKFIDEATGQKYNHNPKGIYIGKETIEKTLYLVLIFFALLCSLFVMIYLNRNISK